MPTGHRIHETLTKAYGFLHQVTNSEFLVSFLITMKVLSILQGVTVKLQQRSDVLKVYELVSDVQMELELLKTSCDDEFHSWFDITVKFGEPLGIFASMPRIHTRQLHRGNIPDDSAEVYYRRNIVTIFRLHHY